MIVRADVDRGQVSLEEPDDFGRFHLAVAGDPIGVGALLAPHGSLDDDGEHAWLRLDAVEALAGEAADDDWRAGFAAMVDFARDHGFLSEDGASIRAHVEPGAG